MQEAGATLEFRIAKKPGSAQLELLKGDAVAGVTDPGHNKAKGGKKFGDLVWPERVLIGMKSRGENLEKHYEQLVDYWNYIVTRKPADAIIGNPRYLGSRYLAKEHGYDYAARLYARFPGVP